MGKPIYLETMKGYRFVQFYFDMIFQKIKKTYNLRKCKYNNFFNIVVLKMHPHFLRTKSIYIKVNKNKSTTNKIRTNHTY